MKYLKYIIILTFILLFFDSMSQNLQPHEFDINNYYELIKNQTKTPDHSSFLNYTEKGSVDLATGRFGLNIPIISIEKSGLNLTFGLQYSTSGVKVEQIASTVGMDWSLMGIGKITRKMNGYPDEVLFTDYYSAYTGRSTYEYPDFEFFATNNSSPKNFCRTKKVGLLYSIDGQELIEEFPIGELNGNDYNNEAEALVVKKKYSSQDTEPDIFTFQVGNFHFSFLLERINNELRAILLDDVNIQIEFTRESKPYYHDWVYALQQEDRYRERYEEEIISKINVTDANGIKYFFEEYKLIDIEYLNEIYNLDEDNDDYNRTFQYCMEDNYISEWYLTKIEFPNKEIVNYTYTESIQTLPSRTPRTHTGEYLGYHYNVQPEILSSGENIIPYPYCCGNIEDLFTVTNGYEISSIEYEDNWKIQFNYNGERLDMDNCGMNLDNIELKNTNGETIRTLSLSKEYANSDYYENYKDYRLFLTGITDSYKEYTMTFDYYNLSYLPSLNQNEKADLYGYYGGYTGNRYPHFPKMYLLLDDNCDNRILYDVPATTNYTVFNGHDRTPNPNVTFYGTMKKVHFPTGGNLEILYESNTYSDDKYANDVSYGPGVRVLRLIYSEEENIQSLIKEYAYNSFSNPNESSGYLIYRPSYGYLVNWGYNNEVDRESLQTTTYYVLGGSAAFYAALGYFAPKIIKWDFIITNEILEKNNLPKGERLKKLTKVSVDPLGPTVDYMGREIIYENVTEYSISTETGLNNGYTRYYFYTEDNRRIVNCTSGPTDDPVEFEPGNEIVDINTYGIDVAWRDSKVLYGLVEKNKKDVYPFLQRDFFSSGLDAPFGELTGIEVFDRNHNIKQTETYEFVKIFNDESSDKEDIVLSYLPTHNYYDQDPSKALIELSDSQHNGSCAYEKYCGLYFFTQNNYKSFGKFVKNKTLTKKYFEGEVISDVIEYNFNNYLQVSGLTKNKSNGDVYKEKLRYVSDFIDDMNGVDLSDDAIAADRYSKAIYKLYKNNMLNVPIESINLINDNVIEASLIKYDFGLDNVFPKYIEKLDIETPILYTSGFDSYISDNSNEYDYYLEQNSNYNNKICYDLYDYKSNIVQFHKSNDIITSIWYGYNQTMPIIKADNVTYFDNQEIMGLASAVMTAPLIINGESFSNLDEYLYEVSDFSNIQKQHSWNSFVDHIRNNLSESQIQFYTYIPLIGISSITDINGKTQYFEYDPKGRLIRIKDENSHILKKFEYHYQNESK